jgi:hypothetical protein
MEIKELISAFEQVIPIYQTAVNENWDYEKLKTKSLQYGICCAVIDLLDIDIYDVVGRYYENYKNTRNYLFDEPSSSNPTEPLQQRLDFMKSEIPLLKKLIKQGYTHL